MSELYYNASNLVVTNGFVRNPERYYLEEFFDQLPVLDDSSLTGDTITQGTSKSTTVILHRYIGKITMHNAALSAGAEVSFTVTNNKVKATNIILVNHISAGTAGAYLVQANSVADGSFKITVSNVSGSGPSEAIVLKFMVLPSSINSNFRLLGTNMTSLLCTYSSDRAGIKLTTAGGDNDQAILIPDLSNKTPWAGIKWGNENQVEWESAISVADIANVGIWAGLKLSNTPDFATDADQAYFAFDTDDSVIGSSWTTTNANLHFIYSNTGTDYITNLGIAVAADTIYRLRISINKAREISIFVNEKQYSLTQISGLTAQSIPSNENQKSAALKDNTYLIPYIGVQSTTAAADSLTIYYQKISRVLYE